MCVIEDLDTYTRSLNLSLGKKNTRQLVKMGIQVECHVPLRKLVLLLYPVWSPCLYVRLRATNFEPSMWQVDWLVGGWWLVAKVRKDGVVVMNHSAGMYVHVPHTPAPMKDKK